MKYCQAEHNGKSHSWNLRESGKVSLGYWNRSWFLKDNDIHVCWVVKKSFLAVVIAGAEEVRVKWYRLQCSVAGAWDKQVPVTGDGIGPMGIIVCKAFCFLVLTMGNHQLFRQGWAQSDFKVAPNFMELGAKIGILYFCIFPLFIFIFICLHIFITV